MKKYIFSELPFSRVLFYNVLLSQFYNFGHVNIVRENIRMNVSLRNSRLHSHIKLVMSIIKIKKS